QQVVQTGRLQHEDRLYQPLCHHDLLFHRSRDLLLLCGDGFSGGCLAEQQVDELLQIRRLRRRTQQVSDQLIRHLHGNSGNIDDLICRTLDFLRLVQQPRQQIRLQRSRGCAWRRGRSGLLCLRQDAAQHAVSVPCGGEAEQTQCGTFLQRSGTTATETTQQASEQPIGTEQPTEQPVLPEQGAQQALVIAHQSEYAAQQTILAQQASQQIVQGIDQSQTFQQTATQQTTFAQQTTQQPLIAEQAAQQSGSFGLAQTIQHTAEEATLAQQATEQSGFPKQPLEQVSTQQPAQQIATEQAAFAQQAVKQTSHQPLVAQQSCKQVVTEQV